MEEQGFDLQTWIETPGKDYELTVAQLEEVQALLEPAKAKCQELGVPYAFIFQGANKAENLGCSLNGEGFPGNDPALCSPNMLLFHILFMDRAVEPQQALDAVSSAAVERLELQAALKGPSIFVPE